MPSLAYKTKLTDRYLNGTIVGPVDATLIVDTVNHVFYSADPFYSFYFFGNLSYYVIPPYVCVPFANLNYGNVTQEFSGLYQSDVLHANNVLLIKN